MFELIIVIITGGALMNPQVSTHRFPFGTIQDCADEAKSIREKAPEDIIVLTMCEPAVEVEV